MGILLTQKARANTGMCKPKGQRFPAVFVPRMLLAMEFFLREGWVSDKWLMSLMKCIPNSDRLRKLKT